MSDKGDSGELVVNPVTEEKVKVWSDHMKKLGDIQTRMSLVTLDIDLLKDPEDAIFYHGLKSEYLRRIETASFLRHVKEVANLTGADPAQIINKDTRTPEQQEALLKAAAREQLERIDMFLNSDYMIAIRTLDGIKSDYDGIEKHTDDDYSIKETAVLYYFATHPDIRPSATGAFTKQDKEALIALFRRLETFLNGYFGSAEAVIKSTAEDFTKALETFAEKENPIDAQEVLERLTSHGADTYFIPNNKLANIMTKDLVDTGVFTARVNKKKEKKPVEIICIFAYEDDDNITLSKHRRLTETDRVVFNGVCSLWEANTQRKFTIDQIARAWLGMTDGEKPTPAQKLITAKAMDKMRFIRTRIDFSAELKRRSITLDGIPVSRGEVDTYFISARKEWVEAGGKKVEAYVILEKPIVFAYAEATKQVVSVPVKLLDVKKLDGEGKPLTGSNSSLQHTEQRARITSCLIRRIKAMANEKNNLDSDCISLENYTKDGEEHEGLYSIAGYEQPKELPADASEADVKRREDVIKKRKKDIREDVVTVLEYYTAIDFIKGFSAYKKRSRAIAGYRICL